MRRRRAVVDQKDYDTSNATVNVDAKRFKHVFLQRWFIILSFPFVALFIGCYHFNYFDTARLGVLPLEESSRNNNKTNNQNQESSQDSNETDIQNHDPIQEKKNILDDDNDDSGDDKNHDSYYSTEEEMKNTTSSKFQWSFLNAFVPGTCGHNKCFFQAQDNPMHGYIIGYTTKTNLTLGWERAKMLEKTYGTRHFYLSAPEIIPVPKGLFDFAIANGKKYERKGWFYPEMDPMEFINRTNVEATKSGGGIIALDQEDDKVSSYVFKVQKMKKAPDHFLEWGDRETRKKRCREQFLSFNSSIKERSEFSKQLREEIIDLNETLWREYWLVADFQVIIDQRGFIYHYDLDRNLKNDGNEMSPYFLSRERFILRNLRRIADGVQGFTIPC